jgi:hypothetical protein
MRFFYHKGGLCDNKTVLTTLFEWQIFNYPTVNIWNWSETLHIVLWLQNILTPRKNIVLEPPWTSHSNIQDIESH